jgi:site-specific recombinase XerD
MVMSPEVSWLFFKNRLDQLFEEYVSVKGGTPKRVQELKNTRNLFEDRSNLMVSDLSPAKIESARNGLTAGSRNGHISKLSAVLSWGKRKGYLKASPIESVDRHTTGSHEIVTASVETVRALFMDALANEREMIPFLVFSFFCGIRPGGEMSRLDWSNVNGVEVVLKKSQTKTATKRAIPLCEAAQAWLKLYVELGGIREGKVVKCTARELELRRRKNWKAVGYDAILQDAARHSFCSYYLAEVGDLTKALLASGHTRPQVFWQHYYAHATPEEARIDSSPSRLPPRRRT